MFDLSIQAALRPALTRAARVLHRLGLRPNHLTATAFLCSLMSSVCIGCGFFYSACALWFVSRLCDGLDGTMARLTAPTDLGGFFDITLDFIGYAVIPLGFAWHDPQSNALAAATLLCSFMGTASSFLAYAAIAAQRGTTTVPCKNNAASRNKAIAYLGGLTEGFETTVCFALMCLMPRHFALFAYGFAALCAITTLTRIESGWRDFS